MQRAIPAIALIILGCAACASVKPPTDLRLVEAQKLYAEGKKLREEGRYAEAAPVVERALELRESLLGRTHLEVARCLNLLGDVHRSLGNYTRAEPFHQRALAIREASLGNNHLDVAHSLNNLAIVYIEQGLYARAEPLYERALAIREAALGKHHPDVATSLNNLAILYSDQGLYARAEPLYERALAIREAALGKHHPDVAASLNNLAILYREQGFYARAEPLYERALAIREAALGKHHPNVAASLNNLAVLYDYQGLYARAEPLYERALAIREASFGKHHPDVATSLNNLAILYSDQGLYARAEPLYERALAIREAALGKHHPDVAASLNNLAILYREQGFYARAEPLYERALAIREAALGKHHPDVAASLDNLGTLYVVRGHYARAEPLYARALAIQEAALGKHHPNVATSLDNLANLYRAQGLYAQAEPLYARALAIRETALGKKHPLVAQTLTDLARLHLAQKNLVGALPLFRRALVASEEHLRQQIFGFSDARLTSFLRLLHEDEQRLYSLARAHPEDARVRHLAFSAALLRKGRSVEELADTSRIIFRNLGEADRETFARLRALRTQFSALSLAGLGSLSPVDYQQRLKDLTDKANAIEEELSRRAAPLRALSSLPPPERVIDRVANALPKNGALIELIVCNDTPLVPTPGTPSSQSPGPMRYLALLLFADGHTEAIDLGPAEPIDTAALHLHDALARDSAAYQSAARALYKLAFRPLLPHLGKVQRLFVSPDGQLNLVPFAALHDGRRFLVDALDITYLTSGKDLLPRPENSSPATSVVVLANPDFSSRPAASPVTTQATVTAQAALVPAERSAALEHFFSRFAPEVGSPYPPLPGTQKEAETIHRLLPRAQLLLGPAATKHALLTLDTPGILHIATHGFFREDAAGALLPDPLLRSGLVLAGASYHQEQPGPLHRENSLVTALELAGLDLWGTQLVVLSACDTGRGDIKLGQGVYGLRHALVSAGAESLVTSLWKVNDETSRELMESYYRNLLAGQGSGEALRTAMKALRQKHPKPYSWAPFIFIGKDSPLQLDSPQLRGSPM
ncbi:CHAT domain-containing tetratricopeptide repeat protein [Pyxidicoccus sp. MSG2]|uniref:CHAT domain-containing tetratricopeptide repeat protein n=1 Tax=Pyxidicoccus sp. MSG2 TaxID=2996790 RepID=UPI0022711ED9|nr:CHAT domain-containing tetratricopeptide repeat protein [Pyxidicoccus sp. MSG2]MCY1015904.1 CHAT domain-containing protein [Pyxidicoccus sp. MSG2]